MFKSSTITSGLINGLLVTFGAYMAVATQLGEGAGFDAISPITWSIIVITGAVAALKDMQAKQSAP